MSSYCVKVSWKRKESEVFTDNKYSRGHTWQFDCGAEVAASASPHVVPLPYSVENAVDPEEAFVASISSCHMLWFLSLAAAKKFLIESYEDNAEGVLENDSTGRLAMTTVTLNPVIKFSGGNIPMQSQIDELHHLSHEKCFIANSVKTKIVVNGSAYEDR